MTEDAFRYQFRTVDFRPAPAGWRVAWGNPDGTTQTTAMPGWRIEEEFDRLEDRSTGCRQVVACDMDDDRVGDDYLEDYTTFVGVYGPDDELPQPADVVAILARRVATDQDRKERAKKLVEARKAAS